MIVIPCEICKFKCQHDRTGRHALNRAVLTGRLHLAYFHPSGTIGETDMAAITCLPWHCSWVSGSRMKTGADAAAASVSMICTHVTIWLGIEPQEAPLSIAGIILSRSYYIYSTGTSSRPARSSSRPKLTCNSDVAGMAS